MKLSPSHYELQIISKQVFLIHENLPNHLQQVKHNKYRVLVEIKKLFLMAYSLSLPRMLKKITSSLYQSLASIQQIVYTIWPNDHTCFSFK